MIGQKTNSLSKVNGSEIKDQKTASNSAVWEKENIERKLAVACSKYVKEDRNFV